MRVGRIWVFRVQPGVWWVVAPPGYVIDGQAYIVCRSGAQALEFTDFALRIGLVRELDAHGWASVA